MQQEVLQVSVKEAARMLGYSLRYTNELIYTGQLRIVGSGKARRVPVPELHRWQRENLNGVSV